MNGVFSLAEAMDWIIAFSVVECLAVVAWLYLHRRTHFAREVVANMAAGMSIMFALRCHLHDAPGSWVLACLMMAAVAHGIDLWLRFQRAERLAASQWQVLA
jgi:hypothetical protein